MKKTDYFVKNGEAEFSILLPENPPKVILTAAEELQTFCKQSTGVSLTVSNEMKTGVRYVSIGRTTLLARVGLKTDYEKLNGDGFVIKTVGGNVILDAKTGRGFLYATYEFIEKVLGVRFFSA